MRRWHRREGPACPCMLLRGFSLTGAQQTSKKQFVYLSHSQKLPLNLPRALSTITRSINHNSISKTTREGRWYTTTTGGAQKQEREKNVEAGLKEQEEREKNANTKGSDKDPITDLINDGRVEEAIAFFNQLMEKNKKRTRSGIGLVKIQGSNDQQEDEKRREGRPLVTSVACNSLIGAFVKMNKLKEAFALFEDMKNETRKPQERRKRRESDEEEEQEKRSMDEQKEKLFAEPNKITYSLLMTACIKANDLDKALLLFDEMKYGEGGLATQPDTIVYASMVMGCVKANRMEKAVQLLEEMTKDGKAEVTCFTAVLDGFIKQGKLDQALLLLEQMKKLGIPPNAITYNTLIAGCGKARQADKALLLFEEMKKLGLTPDRITYNSLIHALARRAKVAAEGKREESEGGKGNELDLAFSLFEEMKQSLSSSPPTATEEEGGGGGEVDASLKPDVITYGSLIDACAKSGKMERAVKLVSEMLATGVEPDAFIWTSLLNGYIRLNDMEKAFSLYKQLAQASSQSRAEGEGEEGKDGVPKLGGELGNSFIHRFLTMGNLPRALSFFTNDMKKQGIAPTFVTYTLLINALLKADDWERALALFKESLQVGTPPDVATHNFVINEAVKRKMPEFAFAIWSDMQKAGTADIKTVNTLLFSIINQPNTGLSQALSFFEEAQRGCRANPKLRPDVVTYTTLISGCIRHGNREKALEFFNKMKAAGGRTRPDTITYNSLINGFMKGKLVDDGLALYEEMKAQRIKADRNTYHQVIIGCVNHGNDKHLDKAVAVFKEVMAAPRRVWDFMLPDATYKALADKLVKVDRVSQAEMVVNELKRTGKKPEEVMPGVLRELAEKKNKT